MALADLRLRRAGVGLGRPWRPYGATIFLDTEMADCIAPRGWDDWGVEKQKTARYAEFGSRLNARRPSQRDVL